MSGTMDLVMHSAGLHFAQPAWLLAPPALLALLWWSYRRFDRRQASALRGFSLWRPGGAQRVGVSRTRLWAKRALHGLAIAALCVALARPLGGMHVQQLHGRGMDVLIALDTSRSMLTPDVRPDRLQRARLAIEDLLDRMDGDAVGLIAFAGEAFLQTPVTTDYQAVRESLAAMDTHTIPRGGTDIGAAIRLAQQAMEARGGSDRVLILITDGGDLGGDGIAAARVAARQGIRIYTVGVGTVAGELIPVRDETGKSVFVRDAQGRFVKSSLDEATLREIAAVSGGSYWPLGAQRQGLLALYSQALGALQRHDLAERQIVVYSELFEWPLLLALLALGADWLLPLRASGPARPVAVPLTPRASGGAQVAAAALPLLLIGVASIVAPPAAQASAYSAERAYRSGAYAQAAREYAASAARDPARSALQFNLGAAEYKASDFARAVAAFDQAAAARDVPMQQNAYYNLGNAYYRMGERTAHAADAAATIKSWQDALGAYDTALQLKPGDVDAKFNRDFVQRKLKALQRRQPPAAQPRSDRHPNAGNQRPQRQQQQRQAGGGTGRDEHAQPQAGQSGQNAGGPGQPGSKGQPHAPRSAGQSAQPGPGAGEGATTARSGNEPMTREQAEQLLDSLKGDERRLAMVGSARPRDQAQPPPVRDW